MKIRRGMRFVVILMAAFALLSGNLVAAASADADLQTVVATLEQSYNALDDMQASFSQDTFISSLKRKERGAGEVFLKKRPSGATMFRFNYDKPRQQIVSNGKTIWYYVAENNQVLVSDMAALLEGGKGMPLNYLTGMGRISKDFTVAFASPQRDKKGNYLLQLSPKRQSQSILKLELVIDSKAVDNFRSAGKAEAAFPVVSSIVHDPIGNRTTIDFSRVKVNRGISGDRFTFKIPSGAEVIKQ
ncbi:outer membrane lipoprotein carrier protein LolA [Geobacter sp. DSM 9736]|uniref:LolA family protein n=1 Tax=Geobacter sp. DSM 9736 TaxID=1277350 RepID=UPI000B61E100|nr:outer membrane lipoprotein carrier protein LolA [Geobacter sp. DSM 9736]SNB47433.1 outer membrane lipoprotein carrier protein [Geobacter sp. DSM 9736]